MSEQESKTFYPKQNPIELGKYYTDHVLAMTVEKLHSKADIADQLAWRDKKIDEKATEIDALREICRDAYEVWAGSEGIPEPVTASEGYLLMLIEQMLDIVKLGLYLTEESGKPTELLLISAITLCGTYFIWIAWSCGYLNECY